MPKIKVTLCIGFAGATHEDILDIDETEWEECGGFEQQQEELINEYWKEWAADYIDGSGRLIDG